MLYAKHSSIFSKISNRISPIACSLTLALSPIAKDIFTIRDTRYATREFPLVEIAFSDHTQRMLEITSTLSIDEGDLHFDFIRSAGPGGQNVNKVATAVQLRFDIPASSLPEEIKVRLIKLAGGRVTLDGVLIIEAKRHRTQEQNKEDAVERLIALIKRAAYRPQHRRPTRPTYGSKQERLKVKKQRGAIKKSRQHRPSEE